MMKKRRRESKDELFKERMYDPSLRGGEQEVI